MKVIDPKIFGLILAGGHSRRMGQDKALIEFHGKPQVEYAFELLEKFCNKVFLSKRKDQPASLDHRSYPCINDSDEFSDKGPLGGILSAMKEFPNSSLLVLACDLPYINEEAIEHLMAQRDEQAQATAYISTHDNLPEPLCAIWEGHAYKKVLSLFNEGNYCPRKVLIKGNTKLLEQLDPHWLDNINTLQELKDFAHPRHFLKKDKHQE